MGESGGFSRFARTGTPSATARSAATRRDTSFGYATPTTQQSLGAAGLGRHTPTRLFEGGGAQKAATPRIQELLRSPALSLSKMSIYGQETDSVSQLSAGGARSLAEVPKNDLMKGLHTIEEMLEQLKAPDALKKLTVDQNFALEQLGFIFEGNKVAADAVLESCTIFRWKFSTDLTKLIKSERAKHDTLLGQTRDSVEAAKHDVNDGETVVNRLKAEADEGKQSVVEDVNRQLEKLATSKQLELDNFKMKLDLKYEDRSKAIKSQGDELVWAHDNNVGIAEGQLEIFNKGLSNAEKELANRKEVMIETVGLAQDRLNLMKAVDAIIVKIVKAANPKEIQEELDADYSAFIAKISEYNSKVDKIDRGTFHVEAAGTDSA